MGRCAHLPERERPAQTSGIASVRRLVPGVGFPWFIVTRVLAGDKLALVLDFRVGLHYHMCV